MIIEAGEKFKGIDAEECIDQFCKYWLNLVTEGSDEDDDPYFITAINTNTNTYDADSPIDLRDYVAVQSFLNSLGIGEFKVTPVGDGRIEIVSENNNFNLKSINYTIEGEEFCLDFQECDCTPDDQCNEDERCTYSLHRKYETSSYDKILFAGIEFEGATYPTAHQIGQGFVPIGTTYPQQIAEYLNSLPESEGGKFEVYYFNEKLYVQIKGSKYKPLKITFQTLHECDDETVENLLETFFQKRDCVTGCCGFECGQLGQLPCPNGQENGCNDSLYPDSEGVCQEKCTGGTAWVDGQLVAAGAYSQPPDCKGECNEGLIATAAGCFYPNESMTVCSVDLVIKTNPNEKLTSVNIGDLGTFAPLSPILLTESATEVLEWMNAPETGICYEGATECVTVDVLPCEGSDGLLEYRFHLEGVNIDFTTTQMPISVTAQYCKNEEYHSCVKPDKCKDKEVPVSCGAGQTFDRKWVRCITPDEDNCRTNQERAERGLAYQCYDCPTISSTDEARYNALLDAKVAQITSDVNLTNLVIDWYTRNNIAIDYRAYATTLLIISGDLPECKRMCYEIGNQVIEVS